MINPDITIAQVNAWAADTMVSYLAIEFTAIGPDFLEARMPVDHKVVQPYRILHGGASVTLAESVGSMASACVVYPGKKHCVGLEVNANHIRSVKEGEGYVIGRATAIHMGRRTHVWETKITNEAGKVVSIGRLTVAVVDPD